MHCLNDCQAALGSFRTAYSLAELSGSTSRRAYVLCQIGRVYRRLLNFSSARMYAIESQRVAKLAGDVYKEAQALQVEILCCRVVGEYPRGLGLCQTARELVALCGMSFGALGNAILNAQATIHDKKSEYSEAHKMQRNILDTLSLKQMPSRHAFVLMNVTLLDILIGTEKVIIEKQIATIRSIFTDPGSRYGNWCELIQAISI